MVVNWMTRRVRRLLGRRDAAGGPEDTRDKKQSFLHTRHHLKIHPFGWFFLWLSIGWPKSQAVACQTRRRRRSRVPRDEKFIFHTQGTIFKIHPFGLFFYIVVDWMAQRVRRLLGRRDAAGGPEDTRDKKQSFLHTRHHSSLNSLI